MSFLSDVDFWANVIWAIWGLVALLGAFLLIAQGIHMYFPRLSKWIEDRF